MYSACSFTVIQQQLLWACAIVWIPGVAGWFAVGAIVRLMAYWRRGA